MDVLPKVRDVLRLSNNVGPMKELRLNVKNSKARMKQFPVGIRQSWSQLLAKSKNALILKQQILMMIVSNSSQAVLRMA